MLLFTGMRLEESCLGMCRLTCFLAEENAQDFVVATVTVVRLLALHSIRKLRVYEPLP